MPEPSDKTLYDEVKRKVYKQIPRHSAYRSGIVVQQYKKAFEKKYGSSQKPYKGRRSRKRGLRRWFAEDWRTQDGNVGYVHKNDVYRPRLRITKDTPLTFSELTPSEIRRARRTKHRKKRVHRFRPTTRKRKSRKSRKSRKNRKSRKTRQVEKTKRSKKRH